MRNSFSLFIVAVATMLTLQGCKEKEDCYQPDIEKIVRQCDFIRDKYTEDPVLPLNQANGRFGSSFSILGLHVRPDNRDVDQKYGNTTMLHIERYMRGKFNMDYLLPVCRIYWGEQFANISDYEQHQSYYDGILETKFSENGKKISVMSWFDPVEPDVACFLFETEKDSRHDVVIEAEKLLKLHYAQEVPQEVSMSKEQDYWKVDLVVAGQHSAYYVKTNAAASVEDSRLHLSVSGSNYVQISYAHPSQTSAEQSFAQTTSWWHNTWQNTGFLQLPDREAQLMWVRSMYLQLSTYNADKRGLPPPTGFAGNCWPYAFTQDLSYISPILLATGHYDVVKSWVEYYAERIEGMKSYAKRMFGCEGAFCPWGFPYGSFDGYHDPETPNIFFYEIHNSGYMARMAYEASIFVNNPDWTRQNVEPIIRECAAFYRSICTKEDDGYWHLFVTPSMGQDEQGGKNQKDYLCALYSAKYCFERAVLMNIDKGGEYAKILSEGLAFPTLQSGKGYYYACQGSGAHDFGLQKHPVQLNELAYLPTEEHPSEAALAAYRGRYDITEKAHQPFFYGWTLGEFMLASSRLGNKDGWKQDWGNLVISDNVDPDFIQVYEGSQTWDISYYSSTNGLFQQSLLNNLVCDWYGKLEIGKCYPWEGDSYFTNITSALGVTVSGKVSKSHADIVMKAWKDADFQLMDEHVIMKKGDEITRSLNF